MLLYSSIALFLFSLTQECYCTDNGCGGTGSGFAILLSGCIGFFLCPAGYTWLANPALFASWIFFNKSLKATIIFSWLAFGLAVSFLFFREVIANEGGSYSPITNHKIGFWIWLLSMFLMAINTTIRYFSSFKINKSGH